MNASLYCGVSSSKVCIAQHWNSGAEFIAPWGNTVSRFGQWVNWKLWGVGIQLLISTHHNLRKGQPSRKWHAPHGSPWSHRPTEVRWRLLLWPCWVPVHCVPCEAHSSSSQERYADDPSGVLNPGKTRKNIHTGFFLEPYNFPKGWGRLPTIIFNTHTVILHLVTILTLSTVEGTSLRTL